MKKTVKVFFGISGLLAFYFVYRAIYPGEEYYFKTFEHVSGVKSKPSFSLISGTASYPDFHGDFSACFLISLDKADLETIKNQTTFTSVSEEKACNGSKNYWVSNKGKTDYENEFMSWYITNDQKIIGYYAQY